MNADFAFLEYSYNPDNTQEKDVSHSLAAMGFVNRAQHINGKASLWTQNHCIILVRRTHTVDNPGVSGLGFVSDTNTIQCLNASLDPDVGLWQTGNTQGLRILLVDTNKFSLDAFVDYEIINTRPNPRNTGIKWITGIKYNCSDPRMMDFFQQLNFKFTRSTEKYNTLVSGNNRLTILCSKENSDKQISTVICDTDDVFSTTSVLTVNDVDIKQFDIDPDSLNFGTLNYKIAGYNCLAFGNSESYTIENFVPDAVQNLDLIFRTRKQYLHITEHTLDSHYEVSC